MSLEFANYFELIKEHSNMGRGGVGVYIIIQDERGFSDLNGYMHVGLPFQGPMTLSCDRGKKSKKCLSEIK